MIKVAAKSVLQNKIANYIASSLFLTIGKKELYYRIQSVGNFLPDYVVVKLPKKQFSRDELTFYCAGGKDQMSRAAATIGWHAPEAPMPLLMQSLFKRDQVFFDVGANSGYYSLLALASLNRPDSVYSFEPSKDALAFFKINIDKNSLGDNGFEIAEIALSDHSGSAVLYYPVDTHNLLETSQTLVKNHKGRKEYEKTDFVEITTIDDFVQKRSLTRVDLIKIDVEGHEEAVLEGGVATLQKLRPIIFFEVLPDIEMRKLQDMFQKFSYLTFQMGPKSITQVKKIVHTSENRNQVAVPLEKKEYFLQSCSDSGLYHCS
ncbi:FkbM family methyltransferase [Roseibium aggregatum]|uniref:FkbM family methyltransferase n=1 Tax=Roseibium aggregatum TaxID=187304 RepID=A0A939IZB2_9HYPH|nr:FkbM family methyltransferase [Roseibium aggregatum]MBN9669866.1 FkbM family methyltransferase [Roseibium aggregatum]